MAMHTRITQFHIRQGKIEEFLESVDSLIPLMRQQQGFRALLVLRGDSLPAATPEATVITVWDSLDSLRASEENLYFYRAMARVLEFSDGFPAIREHEVLASEFAPPR